jgi:hypothetical protein
VQSVIDERDGVVKRLQRELNERDTDLRKSHMPIPEVPYSHSYVVSVCVCVCPSIEFIYIV